MEQVTNLIIYVISKPHNCGEWVRGIMGQIRPPVPADLRRALGDLATRVLDNQKIDALVAACYTGDSQEVDIMVIFGRSSWLSQTEASAELTKLRTVLGTQSPSGNNIERAGLRIAGFDIIDTPVKYLDLFAMKATYNPGVSMHAAFFNRPYEAGDLNYARRLGLH